MQVFLDWLKEEKGIVLSEQQRAAVEKTEGAGLLVATPGSGKTTVIVCRTAALMRVKHVPPQRILTLTFGKQSQLDMDRRFARLFPEMEKPRFSTIHALCLEVLRRYSAMSGREMFALRQDCTQMVRQLLTEQTGGYVDEEMLQEAQSALDRICNSMKSAAQVAKTLDAEFDLEKLHADYTRIKREKRIMDFNDLLIFANRALDVVPQLLEEYRGMYDYLQIDEAQDTSPIQQVICDKLTGEQGNLFLVGDEDQSIYGFRGANPDYLMRFEQTHPGAQILYMETNYRSCPEIVEAGQRIIQYNAYRRQKRMTAARSDKGIAEECSLRDWSAQAQEVVRRAQILKEGKTLGVLFRNNDSMPALCDALMRAGIPFCVSRKDGKPPLFTHYALRQLRSIIRLSFNPTDGDAFYDVRNRIKKDIPLYIAKQIRDSGEDVFEQLIERMRLGESDAKHIRRKAEQVAGYKKQRAYPAVCAMVEDFRLSGYNGAAKAKTDALMTLAMGVETLDHYTAKLNELELLFEADTPRTGSVYLSTIHAAKGLEYDEVMLVDGMQGVLPASEKEDTPEERAALEEETRLMYVAVTRARERFTYLTATTSHGAPCAAGMYLKRLFPPVNMKRPQERRVEKAVRGFLHLPMKKQEKRAEDYSAWLGRSIVHKRFGEGKIAQVDGSTAKIVFAAGEKVLDLRTCVDNGLISIKSE